MFLDKLVWLFIYILFTWYDFPIFFDKIFLLFFLRRYPIFFVSFFEFYRNFNFDTLEKLDNPLLIFVFFIIPVSFSSEFNYNPLRVLKNMSCQYLRRVFLTSVDFWDKPLCCNLFLWSKQFLFDQVYTLFYLDCNYLYSHSNIFFSYPYKLVPFFDSCLICFMKRLLLILLT